MYRWAKVRLKYEQTPVNKVKIMGDTKSEMKEKFEEWIRAHEILCDLDLSESWGGVLENSYVANDAALLYAVWIAAWKARGDSK